MVGLILLVLLLALIALPYVLEWRKSPPDRTEAPGEFVQLSQGTTHYRWLGPIRGPVVVAIHGLTTPSPIWESMAKALGDIGYRTLVYDLYGRGYSDAPSGPQDAAFFQRQLDDLVTHLKLDDDLTIMGYSMGAIVATVWAAENQDRVRQVVLLASAGHGMTEIGYSGWIRDTPVAGDWLHYLTAGHMARGAFDGGRSEVPDLEQIQDAQYSRKGFLGAVLSSRRHIFDTDLTTPLAVLNRREIPVFAIWGQEDHIVPDSALGDLAALNHDVHQEVIADAGHGLPYTHGREVAATLREMMRKIRKE
ncbi:alpha/beta fold hydrolase [Aestuariibius insulae]|uniref:alpha/beta fold hydrolase n=1 Tax=Aestuariibius insulae TaxID=2058287 RepID=UPI00345EA5A2